MAVQLLNAPKLNTNYASNDSYGKLGQYLLDSVHQKNVLAEQKAQNNALGQYRNQQLGLERDKMANQQAHNETMQALQGQKVANDYTQGQKLYDLKLKEFNKGKQPSFSSVSYIGDDGKPMIGILNSVDGSIKPSGLGAYQKPSQVDEMTKMFGIMNGLVPFDNNPSAQNNTVKPTQTTNTSTQQVKPINPLVEAVTSKYNKEIKKEDGSVVSYNPITKTETVISVPTEEDKIELQKKRNELADENITLETTVKNSNRFIDQIDGIINNPNLDKATGFYSYLSPVPNTQAKSIGAEIDTIKGGAFLSAVQSLRGMGALSDAEGKKLTESIANLDMTQSTDDIKKQLNYIKTTMQYAKDNALRKLKVRGQGDYEQQLQNEREALKNRVRQELKIGQ